MAMEAPPDRASEKRVQKPMSRVWSSRESLTHGIQENFRGKQSWAPPGPCILAGVSVNTLFYPHLHFHLDQSHSLFTQGDQAPQRAWASAHRRWDPSVRWIWVRSVRSIWVPLSTFQGKHVHGRTKWTKCCFPSPPDSLWQFPQLVCLWAWMTRETNDSLQWLFHVRTIQSWNFGLKLWAVVTSPAIAVHHFHKVSSAESLEATALQNCLPSVTKAPVTVIWDVLIHTPVAWFKCNAKTNTECFHTPEWWRL